MSCYLMRYQCSMLLVERWRRVHVNADSGQHGGRGDGMAVIRRTGYTPDEENAEIKRLFALTGNYTWADAFKWRLYCEGADRARAAARAPKYLQGGGNGAR